MHQSKLLQALSTFSAKEWKRFGEFLDSPYHNKSEAAGILFEELRKVAPDFPPDKVERFAVWQRAFPGVTPDDKSIAYLMNELLGLVGNFFAQEKYEKDLPAKLSQELEAWHERGLDKHFRQTRKRLRKEIEKFPHRSAKYFQERHVLSAIETRNTHLKQQRTFDAHLQETVDTLDQYYLCTKLRLTCELINRQQILNADYNIRLADELLSYLQNQPALLQTPAISIYHHLLKMLLEPGEGHFFELLLGALDQSGGALPENEQREIYAYAQNHCIRGIRSGQNHYLEALFDLYNQALPAGMLHEDDGFLSPWKFKNIVSVAIRIKKSEWGEDFVLSYVDDLAPEFRDSALAYNQAHLQYDQKKYGQALQNLQKVEFSDLYYALDTRKMMLKIYFEQQATEPLHSLIAAFRIFLKRNKLISENNRQAYQNFIQAVSWMQRAIDKGEHEPVSLSEKIGQLQPITDKEWLLKQADLI